MPLLWITKTSIVADPVCRSVGAAQPDGVATVSGSGKASAGTAPTSIDEIMASLEQITGYSLGSSGFRQAYGLHSAYVAGPMHYGISGFRLVASMARNGMLAFLGSRGLSLDKIERAIRDTQAVLPNGESFGVGISADLNHPGQEMALVDNLLSNNVRVIEAAGFIHHSPALIRYRAAGLQGAADGTVRRTNRIIGKASRLELAELLLRPPPSAILAQLVADDLIPTAQAEFAAQLPLTDDICALADCGGHTDLTNMSTLLPAVLQLREEIGRGFAPARVVHIGVARGIGTLHAIASALMLGAEFIETGSINQYTAEAQISDSAKDMLQAAHIQDTEYAPAGDMFELGGRVQVLKKGVFFPARTNRLYHLWRNCDSLECIAPETQKIIEEKYLRKSFDEVWSEILSEGGPGVEKAKHSSHHRMALVFQKYFQNSLKIALEDSPYRKVDAQIYCGSTMGAFNLWVQDTELRDWRNRHVVDIAQRLLNTTALLIRQRLLRFCEISAKQSEIRIEADQ